MRLSLALAFTVTLSTAALADSYPVQGRWGAGQPSKQPVDCSNLRVIAFNGDQRTDSRGGVPAYRNVSVTPSSGGARVVDEFNTGQIRARATFTLRQVDPNNVEMDQQPGGLLKLQRCK
jgi:hypothetical protein